MTTVSGWTARGWEEVRRAFDWNFEMGNEVGAAFSAYYRGSKVVDLWGGVADEKTDRNWDEDTLVLVYSTTKGITAMCANRLADQGALDVESAVSDYWPEFAQAGKNRVTVADLLAHRAGLAWVDTTMSVEEVMSWDPVIRALEVQRPSWPPGTAHGYHATTYGWLVGEVIRRITGKSLGTYLREEIAAPLGAEFFVGLPKSEHHRVARLIHVDLDGLLGRFGSPGRRTESDAASARRAGVTDAGGEPQGTAPQADPARFAELMTTYLGRDGRLTKALAAPGGALRDQSIWDDPRLYTAEIPAANGICDARSLALLYSSCLGDVVGGFGRRPRTISADQLDRALRQETSGPDQVLLGLDVQWGLGFMLNRGLVIPAGLGGPRSFGHFGMGGSVGWADPDTELAIGYVMNRMTLGVTGDDRAFTLVRACVECARRE